MTTSSCKRMLLRGCLLSAKPRLHSGCNQPCSKSVIRSSQMHHYGPRTLSQCRSHSCAPLPVSALVASEPLAAWEPSLASVPWGEMVARLASRKTQLHHPCILPQVLSKSFRIHSVFPCRYTQILAHKPCPCPSRPSKHHKLLTSRCSKSSRRMLQRPFHHTAASLQDKSVQTLLQL